MRRCSGSRRSSESGRQSRTRSHSRSGRRSFSRWKSGNRGVDRIKKDKEKKQKKLKEMETGKIWNTSANEKQFQLTSEVKQTVVDDMRQVLKQELNKNGEVSASIKKVVKKVRFKKNTVFFRNIGKKEYLIIKGVFDASYELLKPTVGGNFSN